MIMGFGGSKLKIKEGTPYTQIRDTLKPLDVVFFSGGDFISAIIKHEERLQLDQTTKKRMAMPGAFSHMGIVVNSDILDHPNLIENLVGYLALNYSEMRHSD